MAWMEKLMMQVALVDQVTKPLAGINAQMDKVSKAGRQGWSNMAMGATTVAAGGMAIQAALGPAIQMDQALQDLHAAGVGEAALKQLSHTALKFSVDYGKSAIEVLGYTAEMRRAMPALPEAMLDSVTKTSAILGAATKSDAETVGQYFRMLYNNQRQAADAMGPDVWAQQVAEMTSMVTSQFGVGMDKLMASVEGMHSLPSTMGVAMEEQLAILAMLQTRMSDGDAVTQFTNLLEGATNAQSKLGVAMLDSQGRLLPIQKILQNIQPLIDKMGGAKAWALLDDAGLGDGALLLQQLIGDATTLDKTLSNLRGVRGLDAANAKAKTMAKSWERLNASWEAIRIAGFSAIMPAINAVLGTFADGAGVVLRWTHLFPNLTKVVSYALLAIVGLSMITGTWMLVAGLAKLATLGLGIAWAAIIAPLNLLKAGLVTFRAILLAVNIAMYANPIGLIVAGIVLLIGAVAAVIYYWDDLKKTFSDWGVFQLLGKSIDWLIDKLNMIPGVNIEAGTMPDLSLPNPENINAPLARYRQGGQSNVPSGGIGQQLIQANAAATTANQKPAKVLHIGEVHMTSQNPMTPEQMAENAWLETP
ncbi:phage tail tape measure protein [Aeromonas caviae]|uniref:phage tail tape measure protein n=1 Tax=Aeromonas caviae TaxID=648 RepID=UPI002DD628DC|nr:phage tail tape measure protein [Aeromonas caviae]